MERYIAIDNVCAWPNLTLMPDGEIVAVIFNQPCHGFWEGDIECWASSDGGKIWEKRGVPAPHDPGTNRMHAAAGLAGDGSIIVFASGFGNRMPAPGKSEVVDWEKYTGNWSEAGFNKAWVCRSMDNGKTWTQDREGISYQENGINFEPVPFGDIIRLKDGSLIATGYVDQVRNEFLFDKTSLVPVLISKDNGFTWTKHSVVSQGDHQPNETAIMSPDGEKVYAAARSEGLQSCIQLHYSGDMGRTWNLKSTLTLGGQHPGHLLKLKDGSILLVYGIRNKPFYGIGAMLSRDNCETWSDPVFLVNLEAVADCGYPASVQLDDGTIVTAYYCANTPAHNRYHMGVVRYIASEFF